MTSDWRYLANVTLNESTRTFFPSAASWAARAASPYDLPHPADPRIRRIFALLGLVSMFRAPGVRPCGSTMRATLTPSAR